MKFRPTNVYCLRSYRVRLNVEDAQLDTGELGHLKRAHRHERQARYVVVGRLPSRGALPRVIHCVCATREDADEYARAWGEVGQAVVFDRHDVRRTRTKANVIDLFTALQRMLVEAGNG